MKKHTPLHANFVDMYEDADPLPVESSFVLGMDDDTHAMQKVDSREAHIPDRLEEAIRSIQAAPQDDMTYMYDRALGAGELYGPNNNADWFGDQELRDRHHTFETQGSLYRHHKSKGEPVGDVVAAAYNEPLSVVDLITRAPTHKIQDEIDKYEEDGVVATSMGAKVKHDICSICGKKSRRRAHYCNHLKREKLKIYDDGRQVYAINPNPRFVDISFVVIRAAPESVVLNKIASLSHASNVPSLDELEDPGMTKRANRPLINTIAIEATNHLARPNAIHTLHKVAGVLRPDEFQGIIRKDADCLRPDCIPYVGIERVDDGHLKGSPSMKIAHAIEQAPFEPLVDERDVLADFLTPLEKRAYLQYRKATDTFQDQRYLR